MGRGDTTTRLTRHAWWRWGAALALLLALSGGMLARGPVALAASCAVTTTFDVGAGSLRAAIADPTCTVITFALPDPSTIALTNGTLTINRALTIQGPGARRLTVSIGTANAAFTITGGPVAIDGLTVAGDGSGSTGFAIAESMSLTLTNSTVSGNDTGIQVSGGGSGTSVGGTLTLTNSTVSGNARGIYVNGGVSGTSVGGTATVTNSTVSGNGTGITVSGGLVDASTGGTATVTNSTVSGNGTGIYVNGGVTDASVGGTATVTNSTVSDNTDTGIAVRGGGLGASTGGALALTNGTVASNGTGITVSLPAAGNTGASATATLANTIVALSDGGPNCTGSIGNFSHNLDDGTSCGFGSANGSIAGLAVLLGPLADNGGPTLTRALLTSSPAIDAGDAGFCPATDQRGVARPQGPRCDIGAFELIPTTPTPTPAPAQAVVDPASLAFGPRPVGTASDSQQVTLSNGGGSALTIMSVTLTGANPGDFAVTFNTCVGTVPAGGSCVVGVRFAPTAATARAATLSIADNAAGSPQTVALSGTGTAPPASPVPQAVVTASATGNGSVTPSGTTSYATGSQATYAAVPAAGQTFVGWTLDGVYVGYANPLTFTVNSNRTLVATFVATPQFSDLGALSPADQRAITFLAALGIVNPNGVNGSGQFQPNADVQRAQVAAFVSRVFGWQKEFHANNFPDKCDPQGNCVDDELWNNVAALKDYGVVGGYADQATCQSAGTNAPCYLPRDTVKRIQVVSVVARAFIKTPDLRPTGFWDRLDADPAQYTNVPNTGTQRSDLTTYRANVGTVPGQTSDASFGDPTGNGTRLYVIQVLYAAFNAQFGVDRVP